MKQILDKLKTSLEKADIADKLNPPVSAEQIAAWETAHNAVIPAEIKEFLQFSDGFRYGVNFEVFPLDRIKVIRDWAGVPDGWLYLGQLISDGCYITSDTNGKLVRCDTESRPMLGELDLEKWIEDHVLEEIYEDYDLDEE